MSQNSEPGAWQTTRDHKTIQEWAMERDAVPVDRGASQPDIALAREHDDETTWSRFFGVFDSEDLVFRYRPDADAVESNHEIMDPEASDDNAAAADETRRNEGMETGHLSQSDTGEAEPVTDEERGSVGDTGAAPRTTTADEARAPTPEAAQLVLDGVHEHRPGLGDSQDEHVSFENAGEERLDLSGWRVHNGEGRTFEFPSGTTVEPGETVRVHSGDGRDEPGDYYWGVEDTVWSTRGGTITVETPDGRRVLETDYKGGSDPR